jgi:glutamate dehydrogenase/leucine dehydrogenase
VDIWNSSTDEFIGVLESTGLTRALVITDSRDGTVKASHPSLQAFADALAADDNFYAHEGCFFEIGPESNHLLGAFVHRTKRGQAAGGVRYWRYPTVADYVRDGLRLSRGMGHKNALAGIWWGGGKGVVSRRESIDHRDPEVRAAVYRDYGRFVSSLRGCYVTAEDAGTTPEDMAWVFRTTRYTTCIPREFGGSGNPSNPTARGVVAAMEAALKHLGLGTLRGKTVAMQGLGNVSFHMIGELIERGVNRIVGSDIDLAAVQAVVDRYNDSRLETRVVSRDDVTIFSETCDIFAPNAVGAILNPRTIPLLRTRVVCGAANNQLESSSRDARSLQQAGILYVPDFLANRMGIVNCSNEQYGIIDGDPVIESHLDRGAPFGVYQRCLEVCSRAAESGRTPAEEAEMLADELSEAPHPLWGHRGRLIIDRLVAEGWADPIAAA